MYSWCGYNNDSIHPDFGEWIIDSFVSNKAIVKIFCTQNEVKYTSDSCIVMNTICQHRLQNWSRVIKRIMLYL